MHLGELSKQCAGFSWDGLTESRLVWRPNTKSQYLGAKVEVPCAQAVREITGAIEAPKKCDGAWCEEHAQLRMMS